MSPQFRKVHRPLLLPITDQFPLHQYCLRCLSAWCRFVLYDLWNAVVSFQPPSLLIGKVWVPVMHFSVYPIHCRVPWRFPIRNLSSWNVENDWNSSVVRRWPSKVIIGFPSFPMPEGPLSRCWPSSEMPVILCFKIVGIPIKANFISIN